jgi:hypothetical protein
MTTLHDQSLTIQRTRTPKFKPDDATLGFGTVFTDHMFLEEYTREHGWSDGRVEPYHALTSIRPRQCCTTPRLSLTA